MSEEWRIEHRNHLLAVDGCPYCFKRMTLEEEPVKIGTWCMIHSAFDCAEPDCYVCGNHQMDERGSCTVLTCRATNTPEVVTLVAGLREAPIEYVRQVVSVYFVEQIARAEAEARIAASKQSTPASERPAPVIAPAPENSLMPDGANKFERPTGKLQEPGAVGDAGAVEPVAVTPAPAPRDGGYG